MMTSSTREKLDRTPDIAFMVANEEVEVHHISFIFFCVRSAQFFTFKDKIAIYFLRPEQAME
jgi:hypothetical protein